MESGRSNGYGFVATRYSCNMRARPVTVTHTLIRRHDMAAAAAGWHGDHECSRSPACARAGRPGADAVASHPGRTGGRGGGGVVRGCVFLCREWDFGPSAWANTRFLP